MGESVVYDPNMQDFYKRIGRIDEIRRSGGGFEAQGTLGRAYFQNDRARPRFVWLRALLPVLLAVIVVKAAVLSRVGEATYDERVATLAVGDTADQVGAMLLQSDPATVWLAGKISEMRD